MKSQKTIFFDIDGTLLGPKDGVPFFVSESTKDALKRLKQNGHRIVICSGRQEAFIHKYFPEIFTSYVAMNGSHVVYEGKTIFDRIFTPEKVHELITRFDDVGAWYNFVGKSQGWSRNLPAKALNELGDLYGLGDYLKTDWQPQEVQANMMDFMFADDAHYERCRSAFDDTMILNRHNGNLAADLSFRGCDKSTGIARFLKHAGIAKSDTIAFGDSFNDITMMGAVGCGIAMGNGVDEVKHAADYITDSIWNDGIYKALKHFELI